MDRNIKDKTPTNSTKILLIMLIIGFYSTFSPSCSLAADFIEIRFKCIQAFPSEQAIEKCSELIKIEPRNPNGYLYRGWAKYFLNDYVGAINDLTEVVNLSPQNVRAYSLRESSKLMIQDYQGVIQDCTIIIELEPNNIYAYMDRGKAKYFLEDNRGAIGDFNKVIRMSAKFHEAYIYRGASKFQLKDYRGAILDYSIAINQIEALFVQPTKEPSNLSEDAMIALKKLKQDSDEILKNELAEAYRLRGVIKLMIDEKNSGCIDLSKAGETGDDKAYDIIQKYCN